MLVVVGVTEIHIQCLYVNYNDLSFDNFLVGAVAIRYVLLLVWGAFYQCRYPLANSWHCNALQCIAKVKVISIYWKSCNGLC